MKKWLSLLLVSVVIAGCNDQETVVLADGSTLVLDPKKMIAVNYWASWCESCRQETPGMNRLNRTLSKKLQILAVNYDQKTGPNLRRDSEQLGILYPVVTTDVALLWHLPEPQVLPTTYLLSPDHKIIKSFYGQDGVKELRLWFSNR